MGAIASFLGLGLQYAITQRERGNLVVCVMSSGQKVDTTKSGAQLSIFLIPQCPKQGVVYIQCITLQML